jgi:hypothetical protein
MPQGLNSEPCATWLYRPPPPRSESFAWPRSNDVCSTRDLDLAFLDKLRNRSRKDETLFWPPGFFAAAIESSACIHYDSLRVVLGANPRPNAAVISAEQIGACATASVPAQRSQEQWDAAFRELFRADYCLACASVYQTLADVERSRLFGSEVLLALLNRADGIVEGVFEHEALEEAIDCYINGVLIDRDRIAIESSRTFLQVPKDNWLLSFGATLHVRVMGALDIPSTGEHFVLGWLLTSQTLITWYDQLARMEPVFETEQR